MIVELISTGTEILLGQILNKNAQYLAQRLNALGFSVLFQSTVGDNRERMTQVVNTALGRAGLVITTGGLGPTQGDITKEVCASVLGLPLVLDSHSVERIEAFFARRSLSMPQSNLRQAMMPQGAFVLDNERGTAPGVIMEHMGKIIIDLPGPPHEMEWMFENGVVPYLKNRFGEQGAILSKVLRTFGIGESALEEKIMDLIRRQTNPTLALLARDGEIHVRITAKASSDVQAKELIAGLESQIRSRINEFIYGCDDENLEVVVGNLLTETNQTLSLAESCTGGLVTSRLTDIPGSSGYIVGSVVAYSNEVKQGFLDIPDSVLRDFGAVSPETALYMAKQIRSKFASHIGIGITGIAGPGGGTEQKPVGLVYIAVDGSKGPIVHRNIFTGSRMNIKQRTSHAALDHLRRYVL
ncbi:competence/damage-inducible protein A [Acetonema longum]|uniref:Putative competence-damage inducible protein n=1 Tax=Acetonema longum DSM 6540 TaxID=1009370 RepID=F7NPE4_9FIRM|nr:competence/damage-inducible protein A [Acetonema longum]EGO62106.1 competence/damage-inducible protein cina [Acetonema longum DSM 6540]